MSLDFEERLNAKARTYRTLGQGLEILHDDPLAEVDIVAVPGLGTNPQECWTWTSDRSEDVARQSPKDGMALSHGSGLTERKFSWLKDRDGLASVFPRSRIILYDYASAWYGDKKVRATMKGICTWLLNDLQEFRKDGAKVGRPLIMIGHSMGGIVVAKTLSMARAHREFEAILNCTVGCLFFGAPFRGSNMAKIALMCSSVGSDAYEALLTLMRAEKNDTLDELTNDFMEISTKLTPPIDLCCVWEQVATNVSELMAEKVSRQISRLWQNKFVKSVVDVGGGVKAGTHYVDKESAVLQGAQEIGLQVDHRNLVRFESVSSPNFRLVRAALSRMINTAKVTARKRTLHSGYNLLSQAMVNQVRQALEGVDMRMKFRSKVEQRSISTWLMSEPLYKEWLMASQSKDKNQSYLWLKGAAGLGKTTASLAAIQRLGQTHIEDQQSGRSGTLSAYFLCEWIPGCNTAEDLLQCLITQLINQEESLAQHGARWFVPHTLRTTTAQHKNVLQEDFGPSGTKATATVDNLWRCLQDMLSDPAVSNVHFIINNIHLLESSGSTAALLGKMRNDADSLYGQSPEIGRLKWLITSRNDRHISRELHAESISAIDLEDDRVYGNKVKGARQQHTRDAIAKLRASKSWSSDLAYVVRNSIENLSEDQAWIDILCLFLGDMPLESSSLAVREKVKEISAYNIRRLMEHAWEEVLSRSPNARLEIGELVQALTIAYEPPTIAELGILTQTEDRQRLLDLINMCSPILTVSSNGEHAGKVTFTHPDFADQLRITMHGHPDALERSQKRQYHGLMALRCFNYIKTTIKAVSARQRLVRAASKLVRPSSLLDDTNLIDLSMEDDYMEGRNLSLPSTSESACAYPIKYLFRHLSEGFPDVAQELCEDDPNFWGKSSDLRNAWLTEYQALTNDLKDLSTDGMSALHIAAGIGAKELVSILVSRYGASALSWTSDNSMTALHVAAINNHVDVVDALIRAGADIEAGDGSASGTALHVAALHGKCQTMTLLIKNGANINATSPEKGPVINAAILSGTVDAVKQIMDGDVRFDLDYNTHKTPLSLSAQMSEPGLFEEILETGREKWLQNVKLIDQALVDASQYGRMESVRILLRFPRVYTNDTMQLAISSAAVEKRWALVNELLDHVMSDTVQDSQLHFRLEDAFYLAATSREDLIDILNKMWDFSRHDITQDVRDFSLYQATVLKKDITVVWLLEVCGADANATADRPSLAGSAGFVSVVDYSTALNAAASTGNAELVKSLLSRGATIDNDYGYALQLAASEGHTKVVTTLLEHGAAVNKQVADNEEIGFYSSTALQAACENNRLEVVAALLARGADPNLGGGSSANPITAATERGLTEVLMALLKAPGINVNVTGGSESSTPLINAATQMPAKALELLLAQGGDVDARNASGDTALIMAALRGDRASVELLCNHGADVTYRSPNRGLPIQVAADSQNALCAHILAERMADLIEQHRTRGVWDNETARQQQADANEEIRTHQSRIQTLEGILDETKEHLEIANKDAEFHRLERQQLESMGALQGQTYESISQRLKVTESERTELIKQVEASQGQLGLANETIKRMRAMLDEERQTNDTLRKRQGWAALQEEKDAAIALLEQEKLAGLEVSRMLAQEQLDASEISQALELEKQALSETSEKLQREKHAVQEMLELLEREKLAYAEATERDQHERDRMQGEILLLESELRMLNINLASAHRAAQAASEKLEATRREKDRLREQLLAAQPSTQEVKEASKGLDENGGHGSPPIRKPVASGQEAAQPSRAGAASGGNTPLASPQYPPPSPPLLHSPSSGLTKSSSSENTNGFRTIHGQHRADGTFGGYRTMGRVVRNPSSDSLYGSSIRNFPNGGAESASGASAAAAAAASSRSPSLPNAVQRDSGGASIEEEVHELASSHPPQQQIRRNEDGHTFMVV